MNSQPNPRIVGACLLGFALVTGAYVASNFGQPRTSAPPAASVTQQVAAVRTPIEVVDSDNNGLEDWRDEFVSTAPVVLSEAEVSDYVEPDTLTGQLGINFMQNVLYARGYGDLGRSDEEVIDDTIDVLTKETAHNLFDTPDITILKGWSDQDIVNYANSAALAIQNNNVSGLENELFILHDILQTDNFERVAELKSLAEVYRRTRDDMLRLPVPAFLVKEHLDLINTYHAMHKDIEAMTKTVDDPAYTLLRMKRYEDDSLGLSYALQNAYLAMESYANLFTADDPALLFVLFSPSNLKIE